MPYSSKAERLHFS